MPAAERPQVVVLTDLSNEPDDEESLVRFLVYANEFSVRGLIATTSTHLKNGPRRDLLLRDIAAYAQVLPNLQQHAPNYPSAEALQSVCKTGQPAYGMAAVGTGLGSEGAEHLIKVVDANAEQPLWINIWGGANTLAQALWEVRATRDAAGVERFLRWLRVYAISDQDDAGPWLRAQFPNLSYICSPSLIGGADYWKATWTGLSGDRFYHHGVRHRFALVDNPWLSEHIREKHGPLGALYPAAKYVMEGDTASFIGLINHGLGWEVSPSYGGWGGRYELFRPYGEKRPLWTETRNSRDTVTSDENGRTETSAQATIWRWRQPIQHDFAARMDWCVAQTYAQANHNPVAVLNGDRTQEVLTLTPAAGTVVTLSAEGTSDPDGNATDVKWWIYPEAGTLLEDRTRELPAGLTLSASSGLSTSLTVPAVLRPATLHLIMEVRDDGTPALWSYRRAVLSLQP